MSGVTDGFMTRLAKRDVLGERPGDDGVGSLHGQCELDRATDAMCNETLTDRNTNCKSSSLSLMNTTKRRRTQAAVLCLVACQLISRRHDVARLICAEHRQSRYKLQIGRC